DLALRSKGLPSLVDDELLVLGDGQSEHHVPGTTDRGAERLVVLGPVPRVAIEDDVEADDERAVRADSVDELAMQSARKRPLEVELLERGLVDHDDHDGRGRRTNASKLEELIEQQELELLERP